MSIFGKNKPTKKRNRKNVQMKPEEKKPATFSEISEYYRMIDEKFSELEKNDQLPELTELPEPKIQFRPIVMNMENFNEILAMPGKFSGLKKFTWKTIPRRLVAEYNHIILSKRSKSDLIKDINTLIGRFVK